MLDQIASGIRAFEVADRELVASAQEFHQRVRTLEALAADGLITIGVRETATTGAQTVVVAVKRIRLTEAGKRRVTGERRTSRDDAEGKSPGEGGV